MEEAEESARKLEIHSERDHSFVVTEGLVRSWFLKIERREEDRRLTWFILNRLYSPMR